MKSLLTGPVAMSKRDTWIDPRTFFVSLRRKIFNFCFLIRFGFVVKVNVSSMLY